MGGSTVFKFFCGKRDYYVMVYTVALLISNYMYY